MNRGESNVSVAAKELCLRCQEVTDTVAEHSAGAVLYRCGKCFSLVDWDVSEDEELEFALRQRKKRADESGT